MEEQAKTRRKNYFIKKKFQAFFIVKFCLLVAIGSLLSGAIVYFMSKSTLTTTFEGSRLVIKNTGEYILPAVFLSSAIVIVAIGFAAILVTLLASHKIAGPLYRMEKDIEAMAAGDLSKSFSLRKADEIRPLAESLNQIRENMSKDVITMKENLLDLEKAVNTDEGKKKLSEIKKILFNYIT
ncbi:MAG: HAMP domain-containing protein [Candidatus Omnitrophica bacterium]|nr:HAMP domain-containing protein [Candidatus Omnitrophota bacterium]